MRMLKSVLVDDESEYWVCSREGFVKKFSTFNEAFSFIEKNYDDLVEPEILVYHVYVIENKN